MKSRQILHTSGWFIFLLISSCTAPVFFEKTLPPEIQTGTGLSSATFINRYDYTLSGAMREKYRPCYQLASREFCRDMKTVFAGSNLINIQYTDSLLPGIAMSSLSSSLDTSVVTRICKGNNTTYLIVLESMNFWVSGENSGGNDEDTRFLSLKSQDVFLLLKAGFSIYNSSGDIIHRDSITYRTLYKTRLALTSDIWLFEPSLKQSGPAIITLTKSISEAYYNKFLPAYTHQIRTIYAGKELNKTINNINERNWDEAINQLKPIAASSNRKLACKAAYNLSILYEIKGNMRESEFWLNKSGGIKPQGVVKYD